VSSALRPFVDTNVLLYLLSGDTSKADRAEALLTQRIVISVQVLNEFAHVARRKFKLEWTEIAQTLSDVRRFADVHPLTIDTHDRGLALAERYKIGLYDAMIAAAAIEVGCSTLMSEDFQTGQRLDGRLTIRNPFA
jgi:predicted nucleic acid-binding protein